MLSIKRSLKKMKYRAEKETINLGGFKAIVANSLFSIKLIFSVSPFYGVSTIVEAIRHNLVNFLEHTVLVAGVLTAIEKHTGFEGVLKSVIIFILIDIIADFISNCYEKYTKPKYLPLIQKSLKEKLYCKAYEIDLACYDNSNYYNELILSLSESEKVIERAENLLKKTFGGITLFICYGSFFAFKDLWTAVFIITSFVMRIYLLNKENKLRFNLRLKENPLQRKRDYIRRVFYLSDYAKELRLYGHASAELHKSFDEINEELTKLYRGVGKKVFLADFFSKHISSEFLINIAYVLYLVIKATVFHTLSCSDVVVLYNSASNLRRGLNDISDIGPYMVETSLYIEKIKKFFSYESKIHNKKIHEIPDQLATLEFRNVSFGYDKDKEVLSDISFTIHSDEKVALVGYNGAGKTTLIKLLMRLYDPGEGMILLNGIDIKEFDVNEYRNLIGAIFQDYKLFSMSIIENVIMDVSELADLRRTKQALTRAGIGSRIESLEHGLDTIVTKEFDSDGVVFSGGEAQKLATARAFYKDAQLLIMDEPSAALDPISEFQLNQDLHKAAEHKTVVFISHRLSTTTKVDKIYMLEKGRIIEHGTHEELLRLGKKYCEMWEVQAKSYVG